MSGKDIEVHESQYTEAQIQLIKDTIAKKATPDELKLFLYRCKKMGFDPLQPGQIHFIKYGDSPGSIVIGLDGFRSRAGRTGKHSGTQRGVLRGQKGECLGAWAEVYRSDWNQPAREEVSLKEYNTGRGQWAKMPETMIKKCAETAALRMAFPEELGGVYGREEMDQAEIVEETKKELVDTPKSLPGVVPTGLGAASVKDLPYVIPIGKHKGKTFNEVPEGEVSKSLVEAQEYLSRQATLDTPTNQKTLEFVGRGMEFLMEKGVLKPEEDNIPF